MRYFVGLVIVSLALSASACSKKRETPEQIQTEVPAADAAPPAEPAAPPAETPPAKK